MEPTPPPIPPIQVGFGPVPAHRAGNGPRLCGQSRTTNSLYMEFGLDGLHQIDDYIRDYPVVLPPDSVFPIRKQGVTIREFQGVPCVFDWVGKEFYPDPSTFIEEARILGVSRKLPRNTPGLSTLTPDSKMVLIHPKAWINQWADFADYPLPNGWICPHPHTKPAHQPGQALGCCAGIWYMNSQWWGMENPQQAMKNWEAGDRQVTVQLPCGLTYFAARPPIAVAPQLTYSRAIFAVFPIHALVAVGSNAASLNALNAAAQTGLPWIESNY